MDYDTRPKVVANRDNYRVVRKRKNEAYDGNEYSLEVMAGEDAMGCQRWDNVDAVPLDELISWIAVLSEDLSKAQAEAKECANQ